MNRGQIISEEERVLLYDWATECIRSKKSESKGSNTHYHFFLKHPYGKNLEGITPPNIVWEIKNRIMLKENLSHFTQTDETLRDLLLVVEPGGSLEKHTDANKGSLIRVRFNVFIKVPQNDMTTVYGTQIADTRECCYVMCRCGIDPHYTTVNKDAYSRISISFGWFVPFDFLAKS